MPTEKLTHTILHSKYVLESRGRTPKSLLVDADVFNQLRAEGVIYRYLRDDGAEVSVFYGLPVAVAPVGDVAPPGWAYAGPLSRGITPITFGQDTETGNYTASLHDLFHANGRSRDEAVRNLHRFMAREHPEDAGENRAAFDEYFRVKP